MKMISQSHKEVTNMVLLAQFLFSCCVSKLVDTFWLLCHLFLHLKWQFVRMDETACAPSSSILVKSYDFS